MGDDVELFLSESLLSGVIFCQATLDKTIPFELPVASRHSIFAASWA